MSIEIGSDLRFLDHIVAMVRRDIDEDIYGDDIAEDWGYWVKPIVT